MAEHDETSPKPTARLSTQESEILLDQLSRGIAQEVPLDEVFRALADDVPNRRLQQVARQLSDQLATGADLRTALESVSPLVPDHLRQALSIGAESGQLSSILAGLAESEVARKQMQRGLRSVFAYPIIVVSLLTLLLLGLSVFIFPLFTELYDDFDLDLPALTQFMFDLARALPPVVVGIVAIYGALVLLGLLTCRGRIVHWVRTSLPLVGRAWMWSGQHEFAALMGTLTGHNVTIDESLACTAASLRDKNMARAARNVQKQCSAGMPLGQAMRESIHFDRTLTSLVVWGEANGTLPSAFREAAQTYRQLMQQYTQFLSRVVPPIMLSIVAPVLLMVVMALFMPLVELINGLSS